MFRVSRAASDSLRGILRTFPAALVYGPRQCGKTTLVRQLFPDWHHVDLERPRDFALLTADLEGFLEAHPRRLIIDEAQRLPELFPALRHQLDRPGKKGRVILLGSASPSLQSSASESLAGRIGYLELTPFRERELASTSHARDRWFWGGFPPIHFLRGAPARTSWLDSYVSTFLERDLPAMGVRLPATRLRVLWTMLTHVHGNLLNVSDLARSLTVSVPTVGHYLDVLESAFMIRRLQPYHANVQKRLTKRPKVYIRDTGLLHFLGGLRRPEELATWDRRGNSFEGLVIEELVTLATEQFVRPGLHFWRTAAGAEVDLLIVNGRRILPIEIKLGMSVSSYALVSLRQCMKDLSLKRGWVIYGGEEPRKVGHGIELVPWTSVARGEFELR